MDNACELPVLGNVCQAVGQGAVQLAMTPFDWLAQVLAQAAAWLFTEMWSVLDSTTLVDLTRPGYVSVYNLIFGLAIVLMLIFFCLQLLTGLIHRDPAALSRAAVGLGKSVLGSFVVVTLTATLLEITDKLSVGIVQATGQTMAGMGDRLAGLTDALSGFVTTEPGTGVILTIILAGLAVVAALVVWFSLLIRKALLLVAVVFAPIALAGLSWDATRGWFGRWASFVIALSCSKLVLVVVFLVAVNQTAAPIDKGLASVSDPIAGIALLLVAAFAPYLAYKFISFIGFDISHAMASEQEAKAAVTRPMPLSIGVPFASRARSILGASGRTSGTAATGADPRSGGQASSMPSAGAAPGVVDSRAGRAAAGGGAGAARAAAGGPVGVGVMAGAQAIGESVRIGSQVGRNITTADTHHSDDAGRGSAQPSERTPAASASSSGHGPSNPWLTPQTPQQPAAIAEPTPPEPIPPTLPKS